MDLYDMAETVLEKRLGALETFEDLFVQWLSEDRSLQPVARDQVRRELFLCRKAIKDMKASLFTVKTKRMKTLFTDNPYIPDPVTYARMKNG